MGLGIDQAFVSELSSDVGVEEFSWAWGIEKGLMNFRRH